VAIQLLLKYNPNDGGSMEKKWCWCWCCRQMKVDTLCCLKEQWYAWQKENASSSLQYERMIQWMEIQLLLKYTVMMEEAWKKWCCHQIKVWHLVLLKWKRTVIRLSERKCSSSVEYERMYDSVNIRYGQPTA